MALELADLLTIGIEKHASDLHLVVGVPPVLRIHGEIVLMDYGPLTTADLENLTTLAQRIDWLPPAWPGHALSSIVAGNAAEAAVWVMLTLLLAALLVAAAAPTTGRSPVRRSEQRAWAVAVPADSGPEWEWRCDLFFLRITLTPDDVHLTTIRQSV